MRTITPTPSSVQDDLNKSVNKTVNGNLSVASGATFDSTGQPLTFNPDNMCGLVIRIGSTANPHSLATHWTASNVDLTITHSLNKTPFGYLVIAKSGTCDVYWGSVAATLNTITLRITDASQDTTIWILC